MEQQEERMLRWFEFAHLPNHLQSISTEFYTVAHRLCDKLKPGPERTVMLRKLLEAKDAAVRQAIQDQDGK